MIGRSSTLAEISDLNRSYLALVQKLISADRATALSMLGMSDEIADLLVTLSPGQLEKLATSNMLLCRIHLDGSLLLSLLGTPGGDQLQRHREINVLQPSAA